MRLGVIHPGAKFFAICVLKKLENKFFVPKIQWWYRHGMIIVDIPILKGESGRNKEVDAPKQFQNPADPLDLRAWSKQLPSGPWALACAF